MIILSMIILFCIYFLGVGIFVLISGKILASYIPGELLVVFGALLTHHLTLLGIKFNAETNQFKMKKELEIEQEKNANLPA